MRRVVVGGLGFVALGWALGSADWRAYWSEFWTTAHAQLRASDPGSAGSHAGRSSGPVHRRPSPAVTRERHVQR